MTLSNIITFELLSFYDGKIKAWAQSLFKAKQTAKEDPTADGTGVEFIASVSQDANGEITATKKTVQNVEASVSGAGGNAGLMTAAMAEKLGGIAAGAEVNVNADWNAASGDAQILNKPTLGTAAAADATDFDAAGAAAAAQSAAEATAAADATSKANAAQAAAEATAAADATSKANAAQAAAEQTAASYTDAQIATIQAAIASGINYKGSVNTYSDLPASPNAGDMYNVKNDSTVGSTFYPGDMNYIWAAAVGEQGQEGYVAAHWDPQAPTIKLEVATETQINGLFTA